MLALVVEAEVDQNPVEPGRELRPTAEAAASKRRMNASCETSRASSLLRSIDQARRYARS